MLDRTCSAFVGYEIIHALLFGEHYRYGRACDCCPFLSIGLYFNLTKLTVNKIILLMSVYDLKYKILV